jgi:hypothetical protein
MNLKDFVIKLLEKRDGTKHLYVTSRESNLSELNTHLLNNFLMETTNVRVYAVHSDGIGNINYEMFDNVFVDSDLTPIDPETMDIKLRVVA